MNFLQIDWQVVFNHATHLFIAYFLALPIGWDREHSKRQFGLRTFPLVAVVTCGFMLVGKSVIDSADGEARIIQGIITGIGFVGGFGHLFVVKAFQYGQASVLAPLVYGQLVGATLLLASGRAGSFITGSNLAVDGGFSVTSI